VISVICVFVRIFVNICKILNVSCFCFVKCILKFIVLYVKVYIINFIVKTTLFQM